MASSFAALHATPDAAELEAIRHQLQGERAPAMARPAGLRARPPANPAELILGLQRTAGNAAVAELMRASSGPATIRRPSVQRAGEDEDPPEGEAGEPMPTPITAGSEAGGDAGRTSAGAGGDAATAGAQTEAGATGEQAGVSGGPGGTTDPEPKGGGSADDGESATSAAESAAGGEGESAGVAGETAGAADSVTGEAGAAGGAEGEAGASGHSKEDEDRKTAEGESVTDEDERVPMEGGPPPASPAVMGRFIDGGRRGTVPFGSPMPSDLDPAETLFPHAYVGGGRTGDAAWAGGGPGRGPKGNQGTGSLQTEIEPKYDTRGNGLRTNADVWVIGGTGVVDVKRDYISSNAGDQGNGWWISAKATAALEAHEQRHVTAAKEVYDNKLQPMLDRIANSATLGKGLTYWSKDAIPLLKQKIGWKYALEQFKEADAQSNANQGLVDLGDYGTSHYPRNMPGPRTIGGKQYSNYLIMGDEPDPT